MAINKTINIISNWKTILSAALLTLGAITWFADTRYVTKGDLNTHQIKQLYNDIETMEVVKGYTGKNQMEMYEMLVTLKKNKINQLGVK